HGLQGRSPGGSRDVPRPTYATETAGPSTSRRDLRRPHAPRTTTRAPRSRSPRSAPRRGRALVPSRAMPIDPSRLREALAPGHCLDALTSDFDVLGKRYSGKVRENFTRDGHRWIIVTDRVPAFDVVLGTIPFKGQVLNQLAQYWFEQSASLMPNHLVDVPDPQCTKAIECEPIPVEMVVRGYLTGVSSTSIWRAYERGERTFCGHALPEGLRKHERLPSSIVTPSTKAPKGEHDESVSKDQLLERGLVDRETFDRLEAQALRLFAMGQRLAAERGMILVDTKYELGRTPDGR